MRFLILNSYDSMTCKSISLMNEKGYISDLTDYMKDMWNDSKDMFFDFEKVIEDSKTIFDVMIVYFDNGQLVEWAIIRDGELYARGRDFNA